MGKMLRVDLLFRYRLADPLQIGNMFHRIAFLDILRPDIGKLKFIETLSRSFRIITHVSKAFGRDRAFFSDHIPNFTVQYVPGQAVAEDSAETILFVQGCIHKGGRNGTGIIEQVDIRRIKILVCLGAGARTDGDDEQIMLT
jgi:hypothetical protein